MFTCNRSGPNTTLASLLWVALPVLAFVATARPVHAKKPKLAVMPLIGVRVDAEITKILTDVLTVRVGELGVYEVIAADEVNAMLDAERFKDALACDNVACAAEIGGALGADYMLTGNVGRLGNQLNIKLALFDSNAMRVVRRVLHQITNNEADFTRGITDALREVLDAGEGGLATSGPDAQPEDSAVVPEGYDAFVEEKRRSNADRMEAERAERERSDRLEAAWKIVAEVATDPDIERETREAALNKFLGDFPEDNPHETEARDALQFFTHGRLVVETDPAGAEVLVNGEKGGATPLRTLLTPGEYHIDVQMEGFFPAAETAALEAEKETSIHLLLESLPLNPYDLWGHVVCWGGLLAGSAGAIVAHAFAADAAAEYYEGNLGARDSNHIFSGLAVSGWALAGASVVTGIVLLVLSPSDEDWVKQNLQRHEATLSATSAAGRL